ncbi:ketopantoate reductase C-terminal domain-containing protein [Rhizobium sp. CC-YZS058]|uniref:ketopantoate reductase C-terminal domain-containing protein n=1 Tax=Rhizobium sp. CC-YZS058 TaxID=3042153 RepID=UPI003A4C6C14
MAQDLEAGRKTEIDYLNGAVVTLASAHALTAPVNACLSAMIRSRSFRALPDIAS